MGELTHSLNPAKHNTHELINTKARAPITYYLLAPRLASPVSLIYGVLMKMKDRKKEFEKKITEYRHFLKGDYDWDYHHILKLLRYKLSRTRKCIVTNNIVTSAKMIGKQIQKVEDLLRAVMEDRYYQQISKNFHKKYGQLKMITLPYEKGARSVPVTFRYQNETPKNSECIHREGLRLQRKAEKMKISDLRKAFDLMSKNILGWWD